MKILFLDTASFFINIALIEDEQVLDHYQEKNNHQLSDRILPLLNDFFQKNNLKAQDLDKIYVANGPGSFTGIRVGLAVAKTIAWDQKIPIYAISTFLLLASSSTKGLVMAIPDRNDYGFCGFYDNNLRKKEESYCNIDDFFNKYPDCEKYTATQEERPTIDFIRLTKKLKNQSEDVHLIKANYLKKLAVEK